MYRDITGQKGKRTPQQPPGGGSTTRKQDRKGKKIPSYADFVFVTQSSSRITFSGKRIARQAWLHAVDDMKETRPYPHVMCRSVKKEYFSGWDKGIWNSNGKNPALYLSQEIWKMISHAMQNNKWSIAPIVHCVMFPALSRLQVPEIDPNETMVNGFVCEPCRELVTSSLFFQRRFYFLLHECKTITDKHTKPVAASASPLSDSVMKKWMSLVTYPMFGIRLIEKFLLASFLAVISTTKRFFLVLCA